MKAEVIGWVATAVGAPIVAVTLCWTLVIFHYHRHSWVSADLLLVALLGEGLVKQGATFAYTLLTLLRRLEEDETWCSAVVWLVTSVHVLQAATLATLSTSRLLALRSPLKHRKATRRTHLVYHLVSLSILSSCIGVAAILAEGNDNHFSPGLPEANTTARRCTFLPHEMDRRYALLFLILHSFLDITSLLALVGTLFSWCCLYRRHLKSSMSISQPSTITADQKRQLLTSSSDLSAMSEISITSASQNGGSVSKGAHTRGLLAANLRYIDGFPHPKTTSLDALPTVKPATPIGTTDTYKSCAIIGKPFLAYDDTTYDRNYPAAAMLGARDGSGAEDGCRWTSESSYISTSTSSTNSRAPCIMRQQIREEDSIILRPEDLRLPSVVSILLLCYLVNHLPVLVVTGLGMFAPWLLPRMWSLPAFVLWAGLAEEFLLPILLAISDRNFTSWVANVYTCSSSRTSAELARHHQGLDGKFRVFNTQSLPQVSSQDDNNQMQQQQQNQQQQTGNQGSHFYQQEPVKFPITNGSLFTSVDGRLPIIHNYRRGKGMRTNGAISSHCPGLGLPPSHTRRVEVLKTLLELNNQQHKTVPMEDTAEKQHAPPSLESIETKVTKQINLNNRLQANNTSEYSIQDLSLEQQSSDGEDGFNSEYLDEYNVDDDDDEPIYATLSSRSCCSATTAANDDFEFYQSNEKNPSKSLTDCDQLVSRYQRQGGNVKHSAQDWTVGKDDEVLKLVLPLIQAYQQQSDTQSVGKDFSEILKTVLECERLQDRRQSEDLDSSYDSLVLVPSSRKQYQQHHRGKCKQSSMAGSLSLNNLDELLEESVSNHRVAAAGEHGSSDEREMVFELPVKSESVLSLYRLPLDGGKVQAKENNINCQGCKQTTFSRHLRQQTPLRQKKLPVPVLSVESLTTALSNAEISYLDNGDLCRHGSAPDLKRVFVSDYI